MDWTKLLGGAKDKIDDLELPVWVGPAAEHAVELAEISGLVGGLTGKQKKEAAKGMLKAIGTLIDIPGVPEPLEAMIEGLIINAAVEIAWAVKFGPQGKEARKALRAERHRDKRKRR